MIKQYSYKDISWYDLESPTKEEVESLIVEFKLDPLVGQELLTETVKPKVDNYSNALYLILHFPTEIDFVIGKKFIITTRYSEANQFANFDGLKGEHAGHIFFYMIKALYKNLELEMETLSDALQKAEKDLFVGKEKKMLYELSSINRDLLDFKASTNMHKSVLESLCTKITDFFGKEYTPYITDLMNEYYKIHTSIQESKEFLEELRSTNDSLLSNKQNEIMKTISVLAFVFLPLSFIAGLFGMNATNMPVVDLDNSFVLITGGMAIIGVIIILIAHYKEWL